MKTQKPVKTTTVTKVTPNTVKSNKTVDVVAKAPSLKSLRDKWGDFPDDYKKRIALREARLREQKKTK